MSLITVGTSSENLKELLDANDTALMQSFVRNSIVFTRPGFNIKNLGTETIYIELSGITATVAGSRPIQQNEEFSVADKPENINLIAGASNNNVRVIFS